MGFITGRTGRGRSFAVIGQLEDDEGEEIDAWQVGFWRDGGWQADQVLRFKPAVVTPLPTGPDAWFILGEEGECLWVDVGTGKMDILRESRIGDGELPMFTDARAFRDGLVAVGMDLVVWFGAGGGWVPLGTGMPRRPPGKTCGLEAVAVRGGHLAACGWGGEVWILSDQHWREAGLPTRGILSGLTADAEGRWTVCGRDGALYRDGTGQWEALCAGTRSEDFWSVAVFRDRLYVASMCSLYRYDSGRLLVVDDDAVDATYYHLSANDEMMLSVGSRTVMATGDGDAWQRII